MFFQSVPCRAFLVAHHFTEMQTGRADTCNFSFGEHSRFVYCLLLKIEISSILPLVDKWETCTIPILSCFVPIAEEHFLE